MGEKGRLERKEGNEGKVLRGRKEEEAGREAIGGKESREARETKEARNEM